MNPDATGFQTGRWNQPNRRGPRQVMPKRRVFRGSSLEASNERAWADSRSIQRLSSDDVRARAASMTSAIDKAVATIGLVAAGVMPRR
jgi:hypothetical protein